MSFSKPEKIASEVTRVISENMFSSRKDYPDWLKWMLGDSPLLERREWEFIVDVRHRIIQEAKSIQPTHLPSDKNLKNKLSIMKDNFEDVVKYLKESSESKDCFMLNYPNWRKFRNLTIYQLNVIAKAVKVNSQEAAAARGAGSSVSLIGGLICLVTGATALRIAGSVLIALGSLASIGSSASELDLLREKIKEAEKILQEDKEYSEKMWNWISDFTYIQDALNTIKSIDVDRNVKKCADVLHDGFKKKKSMDELMKKIGQILKPLNVSPEIIKEIADVIGMLMTTAMLYDRYRPLFAQMFEAFKCKKVLDNALDIVADTAKVTLAFNASKSSKLTSLQKFRLGIGVALDAMNIMLASENINSTSKESKEITKAADMLKEEAAVFLNLYVAVKFL